MSFVPFSGGLGSTNAVQPEAAVTQYLMQFLQENRQVIFVNDPIVQQLWGPTTVGELVEMVAAIASTFQDVSFMRFRGLVFKCFLGGLELTL